jgi:hypothetical protein
MPTQVKAWKAADGSLHPSRTAAAEVDLRAVLKKHLGNDQLVTAVIQHGEAIYTALGWVYGPQPMESRDAESR